MRRLLVTGGAGFIGSHFVEHCLSRALVDRIVVLDALTYAGDPANLLNASQSQKFRFVQGDICDQAQVERLLREEGLDGIVNFAAETSVDRSIAAPDAFLRSNVQGAFSLLAAARSIWCSGSGVPHRFHQISTDEVFGSHSMAGPLRDESARYAPGSPYAASKAAADHLVLAWRNTYGVNASISYSSNVYGPRQQPEKLIPLAVGRLLAGEPVPVFGDGSQLRSWMFVRDLCRALEVLLASDTEGKCLYVGGELELPNIELLSQLAGLAGRGVGGALRYVADRPGHDRRYGISSETFKRLTGFREMVSWRDGLVETFNWYQQRRASGSTDG